MKNRFQVGGSQFLVKVSNAPIEFWLIFGLFIPFLFFYFVPTFFRSEEAMAQGFSFIQSRDNMIGGDHYEIVNSMSRVFLMGTPRFVLQGPYPPFTILFHMPFIFVDTRTSYILIALMILAAFIISTLALPSQIQTGWWHPALVAIFFTGLFSYGLQFEVERGQFNLIAVSCSLASVWFFHRYPRLRWLAYILFTVAVQLKVYPAIFIINLVDDWRDWKGIAKRFIGLGLLNFAMLFIFGIDNFFRFFGGVSGMASKEISSSYNHSAGSYVGLITEKLPELSVYSSYLAYAILAFILLCLAMIVYQSYKNELNGINPLFVLSCAVAAQLIPRISFDYTLSFLPAAMAFFLMGVNKIKKNVITSLALLLICTAYGSTLFASPYKFAAKELIPVLTPFSNNFLALMVILTAVMVLSFYIDPGLKDKDNISLK